MKKIISVVFVLLAAGLAFFYFQKNKMNNDQKFLTVGATLFPLYDIVKNVGGEDIVAVNILPPGASPHSFEPTPSDVIRLQDARVIFTIGHGIDSFAIHLVDDLENARVVTVDSGITLEPLTFEHEDEEEGEEEHEEEDENIDPHYWLNPKNAKIMAQNIANELITLDPGRKDVYILNAEKYSKELDALDEEIRDQLSLLPKKEIIVFHDAWGYFSREYGLEVVGAFEPSAGKEPSPQYLKALYDSATEHEISVIFSEPQHSSAVLQPFVKDLGLTIFELDPEGAKQRTSYIELMRYNAKTLQHALSQ